MNIRPFRSKVIEHTQDKNPAVYLCGKLLSSGHYTLQEMEFSKPMLGFCGEYAPHSITFTDYIGYETGDVLIIVYPSKRYEFVLESAPHANTKIDLTPDPP